MANSQYIKEHQRLVNRARFHRVKKPVFQKPIFLREQLGPVSSVKAIRQLMKGSGNPEQWIEYCLPSKMGTVWYAQLDPKTNSAAQVDSTVRRDASSQVEKVFALRESVEEDAEGESDDEGTAKTVDDEEVESIVTKSELWNAGTASNVGSTVPTA